MAHTPFHRPGQWDTGYYTRLPATNPNTRGRYAVDFSKQRPYQVIGVNRRPEYLNQGGTGLLNTVKDQANTPTYQFWNTPVGGSLIGTASDVAEGANYVTEGLGTGLNIARKFTKENIVNPLAELFVDPAQKRAEGTLGGVIDANALAAQNLDTTYDIPQAGGPLGPDFGEFSNIRAITNSDLTKSILDSTQNLIADLDEKYPSSDGSAYANVLDPKSNQAFAITENKEVQNQLSNSSQTEVSQSINEIPIFNQDVSDASSTLANALDSKKEIDMSDPDEKQTWQSRVNNGINGFMDRLGDPGFQTALAMHMEAKNGGDATDVLFAGVKQTNKSKEALFQSQLNELKMEQTLLDMEKTQLGMQKTQLGMIEPKTPSKETTNLISQALQGGKYNLKEGTANAAAGAIAQTVEQYRVNNPNTPVQELINAAIQTEEMSGRLTQDPGGAFGWFNRGTYDVTRSKDGRSISKLMNANPGVSREVIIQEIVNAGFLPIE